MIDAVKKESLSSNIARAVRDMIDRQEFEPGHRLPTIVEMARQFEVGAPTLREALRQLQAIGIVEMRHGSGIYVAENHDALFLANPILMGTPSRKVMIDLINTRLAIETFAVGLAAENITEDQLTGLAETLSRAEACLERGELKELSEINIDFHRGIALASLNRVTHQVLDLLAGLFQSEQYAILEIYGSPRQDLEEHKGILEALGQHDAELCAARMRNHLEGVREVLIKTDDRVLKEVVEA